MRFDAKIETRLLKALDKFKNIEPESITEEEALNKEAVYFVDAGYICLIEARTEEAKGILFKFINKDEDLSKSKIKEIQEGYKEVKEFEEYGCKYSIEYLKKIINLFNVFKDKDDDAIKIYSKKDYPLIVENRYFRVILAPRVETE